jgi:hypothetical protein
MLAASPAWAADAAFTRFSKALGPTRKLGVSRATFDAATRWLEPDLTLPDLVIPGGRTASPRKPSSPDAGGST